MNRLKTIGRELHRSGRLAVSFAISQQDKTVTVKVQAARNIPEKFGDSATFVRAQIHKKKQSDKVVSSLFSTIIEARKTKLSWRSQFHQSTNCPNFNEEVVFSLQEMWDNLEDYRLYLSVMAADTEELEFVGCLSFSFEELVIAPPLQWYWLLTKARGLVNNVAVDHEEHPTDPVKNVRISGRKEGAANEFINGTYIRQEGMEAGRPLYREQMQGLYLYFHEGRGAWAIGDAIGSHAPYAYVEDRAGTPDTILRTWAVFSLERTFKRPSDGSSPNPRGAFIADPGVLCTPLTARAGAKLVRRSSSVKVTREMKLNELVSSFQSYMENLRLIDGYYNETEDSITPEEQRQLFANFPEILSTSAEWLQQLRGRQSVDPDWVQPIGTLLLRGAQLVGHPLIKFCQSTQHSSTLISRMAAVSPAFADELQDIQQLMKTEVTLTAALRFPSEQAIATQQMVAFIANSTPIFNSDREKVLEARNAFDSISARVLAREPLPQFVISPHSDGRSRRRSSIRHSGIFEDVGLLSQSPFLGTAPEIGLSPKYKGATLAAGFSDVSITTVANSAQSSFSGSRKMSRNQSIAEDDDEDSQTSLQAASQRSTHVGSFTEPWLHGPISTELAEQLLAASGRNDGKFLVRQRAQRPGEYVLTMAVQGRPAHYLITESSGTFMVNRQSFGSARSLVDLVRLLSSPHPDWPQILTVPVLRAQ